MESGDNDEEDMAHSVESCASVSQAPCVTPPHVGPAAHVTEYLATSSNTQSRHIENELVGQGIVSPYSEQYGSYSPTEDAAIAAAWESSTWLEDCKLASMLMKNAGDENPLGIGGAVFSAPESDVASNSSGELKISCCFYFLVVFYSEDLTHKL